MSLLTRGLPRALCLIIAASAAVPAFSQPSEKPHDNGRGQTKQAEKNKAPKCDTKSAKQCALTVKLVEDGGFAARHNVYEVKVGDLNKSDEKTLTNLLKKTDLLKDKTLKNTNPNAADVIFYQFTVDGKKNHSVITYDDTTMPPAYRDLVNYLHKAVQPTH